MIGDIFNNIFILNQAVDQSDTAMVILSFIDKETIVETKIESKIFELGLQKALVAGGLGDG